MQCEGGLNVHVRARDGGRHRLIGPLPATVSAAAGSIRVAVALPATDADFLWMAFFACLELKCALLPSEDDSFGHSIVRCAWTYSDNLSCSNSVP